MPIPNGSTDSPDAAIPAAYARTSPPAAGSSALVDATAATRHPRSNTQFSSAATVATAHVPAAGRMAPRSPTTRRTTADTRALHRPGTSRGSSPATASARATNTRDPTTSATTGTATAATDRTVTPVPTNTAPTPASAASATVDSTPAATSCHTATAGSTPRSRAHRNAYAVDIAAPTGAVTCTAFATTTPTSTSPAPSSASAPAKSDRFTQANATNDSPVKTTARTNHPARTPDSAAIDRPSTGAATTTSAPTITPSTATTPRRTQPVAVPATWSTPTTVRPTPSPPPRQHGPRDRVERHRPLGRPCRDPRPATTPEPSTTRSVRRLRRHGSSAVLVVGARLFLAVRQALVTTRNPVYRPTTIVLGAMVVPAAVLSFVRGRRLPYDAGAGASAPPPFSVGVVGTVRGHGRGHPPA